MKLSHSDNIPAHAEEVFNIVKNDLPSLVPYLPSVKKIVLLEHKSLKNNKEKIINHWFADIEMPKLLAKFISNDLLSWKDTATWDQQAMKVKYHLESFVANDLFTAKGCNEFKVVDDDNMELVVTCEVTLNPDQIPGVPKLMKKTLAPLIEAVIEKMLQPNLESLGLGLKSYLQEQEKTET